MLLAETKEQAEDEDEVEDLDEVVVELYVESVSESESGMLSVCVLVEL